MAWDTNFDLPSKSFLSDEQEAGLAALFRAIHPSDRKLGIPGADDAGAARFVGLLLARNPKAQLRIHADLDKWRENYPNWLADLDAIAKDRFKAPLAELGPIDATVLIKELEAGKLEGFSGNARTAFTTLWRHCLQGCWSDPRWGGNRSRIMWRWLGHLYDPQSVQLLGAEIEHAGA